MLSVEKCTQTMCRAQRRCLNTEMRSSAHKYMYVVLEDMSYYVVLQDPGFTWVSFYAGLVP